MTTKLTDIEKEQIRSSELERIKVLPAAFKTMERAKEYLLEQPLEQRLIVEQLFETDKQIDEFLTASEIKHTKEDVLELLGLLHPPIMPGASAPQGAPDKTGEDPHPDPAGNTPEDKTGEDPQKDLAGNPSGEKKNECARINP